jgi:energy-coupling factor transporter ATP-binding protein EcfA2
MPRVPSVRITSVQFENFKAFEHFTISLDDLNVLVGPNNSGKSTIVGALRALDSAIKIARSRPPTRVFFGTGSEIGYRIPEASLPISLENVHTNYNSYESTITFRLNNGNRLRLVFPDDGGCVLIPHVQDYSVTTTAQFKGQFPINLTVVPVLGPVEHREARRERDTVVAGLSTHRASRHFRSYWHYFDDGFSKFAELVKATWSGMEIGPPELDRSTNELSMFCLEGRITRELYWVGFGFQIWCQLVTHLSRAKGSVLLVVDEPEIYLHPDVQRQLLGIMRDIGTPVLMATHSSEIMSEADPSEIVIVEKRRRSGERLKDISGIQKALETVGSAQNITLTALARSRRVLFVEGANDFRVLRRFARKIGMREVSAGIDITPLESGGFSSWERVTTLASGIADVLGSPLIIAAIYDRDYFCQEYLDEMLQTLSKYLRFAHIHQRKEIENYFLVPAALDRAIAQAASERGSGDRRKSAPPPNATELLREITDPLKDSIQSQVLARRWEHLRSQGRDLADVSRETMEEFAVVWDDLSRRLEVVPGKDILRQFRAQIQGMCGISLTDNRIIDAMRREDISNDLIDLLHQLEAFRKNSSPRIDP